MALLVPRHRAGGSVVLGVRAGRGSLCSLWLHLGAGGVRAALPHTPWPQYTLLTHSTQRGLRPAPALGHNRTGDTIHERQRPHTASMAQTYRRHEGPLLQGGQHVVDGVGGVRGAAGFLGTGQGRRAGVEAPHPPSPLGHAMRAHAMREEVPCLPPSTHSPRICSHRWPGHAHAPPPPKGGMLGCEPPHEHDPRSRVFRISPQGPHACPLAWGHRPVPHVRATWGGTCTTMQPQHKSMRCHVLHGGRGIAKAARYNTKCAMKCIIPQTGSTALGMGHALGPQQ